MQFNLYATFRLIAGVKSMTLDLPEGTTVQQAVHAVVDRLPVLRRHWLDDGGEIHAHVHIFINGHDVTIMEKGVESRLSANDVLDFFPPVAGGAGGQVIVLAMHGAPPSDFPPAERSEFFSLHAAMEHAPASQRARIEARYRELDQKMRGWPRSLQNDPYFSGASVLRDALEQVSGSRVLMGFNDFCAPSLDEVLAEAAESGAAQALVITPMMTRGGEHSEHDIPEAVARAAEKYPDFTFRYVWPFQTEDVAAFLIQQAARFQ